MLAASHARRTMNLLFAKILKLQTFVRMLMKESVSRVFRDLYMLLSFRGICALCIALTVVCLL